MDFATVLERVISFILGFIGAMSILFIVPLGILGIILLILSFSDNKKESSKKKLRFWGIISLITPFSFLIVTLILYALMNVFL